MRLPRPIPAVAKAGLLARIHEEELGLPVEHFTDKIPVAAFHDPIVVSRAESVQVREDRLLRSPNGYSARLPHDGIEVEDRDFSILRELPRARGLPGAGVAKEDDTHRAITPRRRANRPPPGR
jgi:hypothetical protein